MVQILEQLDIGEQMGRGAGQGFAGGMQALIDAKLQNMQNNQRVSAQDTSSFLKKMSPSGSAALDFETIQKINNRVNELSPQVGKDQAQEFAFQEFMSKPSPQKKPSLLESILNPSSINKGVEAATPNFLKKFSGNVRGQGLEGFNETIDISKLGPEEVATISEEQIESMPNKQRNQFYKTRNAHKREAITGNMRQGATFPLEALKLVSKKLSPGVDAIRGIDNERSEKLSKAGLGGLQSFGTMLGESLPLAGFSKLISMPLSGVGKLVSYFNWIPKGKIASLASSMIKHGTTFGTYEGLKTAIEEKKFSPKDIGEGFLLGAGFRLGAEFLKPLSSAMKRIEAKVPSAGAQTTSNSALKIAESEGINVAKVYEGNKAESKKFVSLLDRVSKEKPALVQERINRSFGETQPGSQKTAENVGEDIKQYAKRVKRFPEEVKAEQSRVRDIKEEADLAENRKRPSTKAKEDLIKEQASKDFPSSKKRLLKLQRSVDTVKDELSLLRKQKASPSVIESKANDLDRVKSLRADALDNHRLLQKQKTTGSSKFQSDRSISEMAENDAANLKEKIKNRSPDQILKENAADKEIAEKNLWKRREVPGSGASRKDTYTKIQEEYAKAYEKRLKDVQTELRSASAKDSIDLMKEQDVLKELIKQKKGRRLLQTRRKALQKAGKTLDTQKKLSQAKKATVDPKLKKVIDIALKKPTSANRSKAQRILEKDFKAKGYDLKEHITELNKKSTKAVSEVKTDKDVVKVVKHSINDFEKMGKKLGIAQSGLNLLEARYIPKLAQRAILKKTRLKVPLGVFKYVGGGTALTIPAIVKKIILEKNVFRAKRMNPSERLKFFESLAAKGVSTSKRNKIIKRIA